MSGAKTEHDSSRPSREHPALREYGKNIKILMKKYGVKSQDDLLRFLPDDLVAKYDIDYTSDTFRKMLGGMPIGQWSETIDAIIQVFTAKELNMRPANDEGGAGNVELKIKKEIYGTHQSDDVALVEHKLIAPSFEKLVLPDAKATYADDFLDAKMATLEDIASGFDVLRPVYTEDDGVLAKTLEALGYAGQNQLFTISGPSGSGKTTISQRLAFDCLQAGYNVYRLYLDWHTPESLSHQIRELIRREEKPSLFIIDGAARLVRGGTNLLDVFKSIGNTDVPVVLLGIETWRLLIPSELMDLSYNENIAKHWSVGRLSKNELGDLVDNVIELETTNKVQHVRCSLSREARINLCSEDRDQYPATALLIFRYGRSVADILTEEFESLDGFVREVYTYVILFAGLSLDIPRSAIFRMFRQKSIREPNFWSTLERVTSNREGAIGLRHGLYFKYLAPYALPNSFDRAMNIINVLISISDDNPLEYEFSQVLFTQSKQVANLLLRNEDAVGQLIQDGKEIALAELPEGLRSGWLVCLGRLAKNTLLNYELAETCFSEAIKVNPFNKFAHRERSWNLLHAGTIDLAEEAARNAVGAFPADVPILVQSATVLQYSSEGGFDYAGELFEAALQIDPENKAVLGKLDRYKEAKAYKTYILREWEDLEDHILEKLRAPWYIWSIRKGLGSARSNKAIRGKLGSLIRDPLGDIDQIREVASAVGQNSDNLTKALVLANLARLEYVQWYQTGVKVDFDRVEKMFKDALDAAPREPFIRTWYGTFLKEVREDSGNAEEQYRNAIELASQYKFRDGTKPFENHPMLLNNLAILLMQLGRLEDDPKKMFAEARELLVKAVKKIEMTKARFLWPYETYEELKRLETEAGLK